jgi:hypothetical protein
MTTARKRQRTKRKSNNTKGRQLPVLVTLEVTNVPERQRTNMVNADVIFGLKPDGEEVLLYGADALRRIAETGQAEALSVLFVDYDQAPLV